jgi:hypothetical protein
MMKATGLKRGSRRKQQPQPADIDKDDPAQRPVTVVKQLQCMPTQRQPPTPQVQPPTAQPMPSQQQENPQQSRKQMEEIATLTTKNYRLAKELVSDTPCHVMFLLCPSLIQNGVCLYSPTIYFFVSSKGRFACETSR